MPSNILDRISFWALYLVIVLLPVFFLPFTSIPVETSKGLLLVVGLTVSFIFWLAGRLSERKLVIPRSAILLSGFGIVLAFFLSSVFSPVPQVSLFGTMFDVGSFWFMFTCFILMFTCSVVLTSSQKTQKVLWGVVVSFMVLLAFQILRFFIPTLLSFGVLASKTENIFGSWNALGIFVGFMSIVLLFIIEFFAIPKPTKIILSTLTIISLVYIIIVDFSLVWILVGIFALLIFIYKVSFLSGYQSGGESNGSFPSLSLAIVMVSLLFFIVGQLLVGYLPAQLKVLNAEVTPAFGSTMSVTKAVLSKHLILGSGPSKFGESWALYKPASINSGDFWNVYFENGFGLLPTFASTTGLLGILAWLVFFFFLIRAGLRSLFSTTDEQLNPEVALFFVASVYLFVSSFFYNTGAVLFLMAFVTTGAFIGLSSSRQGGVLEISFAYNPRRSFFFIFTIVILIIVSAGLGFKYLERLASVPYFARALRVTDTTTPAAEASISRALSLNQSDLYLRTYSQIYLFAFNSTASRSSLSDSEKAGLQAGFTEAVSGAQLATTYDKLNYLNFQTLGYVYGTAGLLGVPNSYDKAIDAYTTASSLNPLNPDLKLSVARAYLAQDKSTQAKDYVTQALNLKPNYVDGFIMMAQISKSEGDNDKAIFYAQRALSLAPDNKDIAKYLDSLQKQTPPPAPAVKDNKKSN